MVFTEIVLLKADCQNVEQSSYSSSEVIVPYVLSDTPPAEWKRYFETQAPQRASAEIVGNIVRYACPNDKTAIEKYGACWNAVAALVENANRYYLELVVRRAQERGRRAEREHVKEQPPAAFEVEFDRYMTRDDTRKW